MQSTQTLDPSAYTEQAGSVWVDGGSVASLAQVSCWAGQLVVPPHAPVTQTPKNPTVAGARGHGARLLVGFVFHPRYSAGCSEFSLKVKYGLILRPEVHRRRGLGLHVYVFFRLITLETFICCHCVFTHRSSFYVFRLHNEQHILQGNWFVGESFIFAEVLRLWYHPPSCRTEG